MAARLWVVVLCLSCVRATAITKGMFCVDPDTGKLYIVNTTWPSTTFCGNYTCRLRQKNITEMEFSPSIPVVNITKLGYKDSNYRTQNNSNQNNILMAKKSESNINHVLNSNNKPVELDTEEDRYLTEDEIKMISEILHTVRKSDLDAIVEIYNIAHDLYKEIDKTTSSNIIEDLVKENDNIDKKEKPVNKNHIKYWYEPVSSGFNSKVNGDSDNESTKTVTTTEKANDDTLTNFKGTLTNKDFGKLPYPYPLSNQRVATAHIKPCPHQHHHINRPLAPQVWYNYDMRPSKIETPKIIQTPLLLPFPLNYIQHQNISWYATGYNGIPWANYNYQARGKNYPQTYLMNSYTNQIPRNELNLMADKTEELNMNYFNTQKPVDIKATNTKLFHAVIDAAKSPHKDNKLLPPWKTDYLPSSILEEVKAHFHEKTPWLKSFPLTKKVKFEKVGKVIKLDELKRPKRNIEKDVDLTTNFGNYETFVISTKCPYETIPGYFKQGNLSKSYPECCPQRISKTNLRRKSYGEV